MKFSSNKEIGNSSLGIAISYFTSQGYTVSIPLNDTQDYDLIVDIQNKLYRVQVKGTKCKTKFGVFQTSLRSFGGTLGKVYKKVKDTNVELIFIVTSNKELYLIPKDEISNDNSINLGKKYQKYHL